MRTKDSLNKSVFDLLLLSVLAKEDTYGYQLTQELGKISNGALRITNGSMYPTLYKLEDAGYISKYLLHGENRKERAYYHIEPSGLEYLRNGIEQYFQTAEAFAAILRMGQKYCK